MADKTGVGAYIQRAQELYKLRVYSACNEECDKAIKQGWRNAKIYNIKALALVQLQQHDKAAESIRAANWIYSLCSL
jgi:Tfp pilus assembly protein PilF